MDEYIKYFEFKAKKMLDSSKVDSIISLFSTMPGISEINCKQDGIHLCYNSFIHNEAELIQLITELEIKKTPEVKKIGMISRWLINLANKNKEDFGNQKLDCCNINKIKR